MNNRLRRVICVMISFALLIVSVPAASFAAEFDIGDDIPSAIVMEASTGTVISEKNADERRAPASVTKVMTMLLIMEAVDSTTPSPYPRTPLPWAGRRYI